MRVLIVDDDAGLLRLLDLAFCARGHQVETVENALGVLSRLAGHPGDGGVPRFVPDICVLDNYMPIMSGLALLTLAARTPGADTVPIVLFSSDATIEAAIAQSGHRRACLIVKGSVPMKQFIGLVEDFAQNPLSMTSVGATGWRT